MDEQGTSNETKDFINVCGGLDKNVDRISSESGTDGSLELSGVTNSTYNEEHRGRTNEGFCIELGDENNAEPVNKITLAWENIQCKVPPRCLSHESTPLLLGVTGIIESGAILAFMGPSGSGKTTLLDILADRVNSLKVSGRVFLNGAERKSQRTREIFRNCSCYVNCEDSFFEIFTVKETMMFTASLALEDTKTKKENVKRALEQVGLYSYRNNRIGGAMFRGLSTGQKRRLSIGLELLKNPCILFLDEPLSGLDNYGANEVMKSLKTLANKNKIIILSVHQPPDRVWKMFDFLTVLSRGMMLFSGRTENALPCFRKFFQGKGKEPLDCSNDGDYILDCINLDFEEDQKTKEGRKHDLQELSREWLTSEEHRSTTERIKTARSERSKLKDSKSFHAGFFWQTFYLTKRALLNNFFHPGFYWAKFFTYILLDILIGSMYIRTRSIEANYIAAMIYFVQSYLVILTTAALPCLILIRPVFLKERSNGLIDVLPYVIATFIAMAPWVLGAAIASATILYYMVDLSNFCWLVIILTATILCAESMVNFIASLTDELIVGLAIATGIFGAFMINAGFILPYYLIPYEWYTGRRVIYHASFHKYSLRALLYNEFRARKYYEVPQVPIQCPTMPIFDVAGNVSALFNLTAPSKVLNGTEKPIVEMNITEKLLSPMLELYKVGDVVLEKDLIVLLIYTAVIQAFLFLVTYFKHTGRR